MNTDAVSTVNTVAVSTGTVATGAGNKGSMDPEDRDSPTDRTMEQQDEVCGGPEN